MKSAISMITLTLSLMLFMNTVAAFADTAKDEEIGRKLTALGFQLPTRRVKAPEFSLPILDGKETTLSSYQGKLVLLNFWATWCPPCREEMPSMERAYNSLKARGFTILAVDMSEPDAAVRKFIQEGGYTFPILLDRTGRIAGGYGVRAIPTSFLIDGDGWLLGMMVGGREWDDEETIAALESLLPK